MSGKHFSVESKIRLSLAHKGKGKYNKLLRDKAIVLYKSGYNTVEIKKIIREPHITTIVNWIKQAGITIVRQDPRHYSDEIKNEAIELYKQGYGLKEVSKKLNICSFRTVACWVKNSGLSRRCGPRKGRIGVLSNNWRGGVTSEKMLIRSTKEYTNWRLAVFERDGFACVGCNQIGGKLHAHHILMFSKYPKMRFVLENGVTLCEKCHKKLHRINKKIA